MASGDKQRPPGATAADPTPGFVAPRTPPPGNYQQVTSDEYLRRGLTNNLTNGPIHELGRIVDFLSMVEDRPAAQWAYYVLDSLYRTKRNTDEIAKRFLLQAINDEFLTQRDAAKLANVHENTVARWVQQMKDQVADENTEINSGKIQPRDGHD